MTGVERPTTRGGRWLYPLLFGMQSLGVLIIVVNGVPLYRRLAGDPSSYATRADPLFLALLAIALIQIAYWTRRRISPAPPPFENGVLAHVVLFAGRLVWGVATAVFGFVFLTQRLAAHMPWTRYVLILFVLFSLFCYLIETLYLGRVLNGRSGRM